MLRLGTSRILRAACAAGAVGAFARCDVACANETLTTSYPMGCVEREAVDWAISNGLVMSTGAPDGTCRHAPFTLAPTCLPRRAFEAVIATHPPTRLTYTRSLRITLQAMEVTPLLNTVVDLGSLDSDFIETSLAK